MIIEEHGVTHPVATKYIADKMTKTIKNWTLYQNWIENKKIYLLFIAKSLSFGHIWYLRLHGYAAENAYQWWIYISMNIIDS